MNAFILILAILVATVDHISSMSTKSEFTYTLDDDYPIGSKLFGNIAGVDVDKNNNVIIFHRGSHKWDGLTFDANDVYQLNREAPIAEETVVTIDSKEKKVLRAWGRNLFFMPHGLSLDSTGENLWLTDVALHQVFKYSVDGSRKLLALGTPFEPGNDESHFCKPTSVADTGEFIFVADGYCNSRVVMFSAQGKYLGEFGQSPYAPTYLKRSNIQPSFSIPHKITYAKEAKMLCVADRENGRIQCFSFEPKHKPKNQDDDGLILNGAIQLKFTIADPLFNGRLFSLDYSPIKGGILVAVSGQSLYDSNRPALGFVYNVTTGQLISRFSPKGNQTFGMAHDLAITEDEAESLYVVDITPVNLWKFSRQIQRHVSSRTAAITQMAGVGFTRAITLMREHEHDFGFLWYIFLLTIIATLVFIATKAKRLGRAHPTTSFASLYSNSYPTSINSLFGSSRFNRRPGLNGTRTMFSTVFSRRAFFNLFDRNQQQQNDFSRIPLEDSDNSDEDKSDSDVEEFNINQATPSIKINV